MKTTHEILLTDEYIAEAQRLAIAQNIVLKLMHQTWWFFLGSTFYFDWGSDILLVPGRLQFLFIFSCLDVLLIVPWPVFITQELGKGPETGSSEGYDNHCFDGFRRN